MRGLWHPWGAFICSPDLTVGTAAIQLQTLNTVGVIGSWDPRGQMVEFKCKSQGGHGYCKRQQTQSRNQNNLTHTDWLDWPDDHSVPRHERERKSTKFLTDPYKQT